MDTNKIQKVAWELMIFWAMLQLLSWIFCYKNPEIVGDAWDVSFVVWIIALIYNRFIKK